MLAAISDTLQAADYAFLIAGGGVLVWHSVALVRSPLRTNPLREAPWVVELRQVAQPIAVEACATSVPAPTDRGGDISFFHVIAVIFVYFAAMAGLGMLIPGATTSNPAPGSDDYFRGHIVFHLVSGASIAFMIAVLVTVGRPPLRESWAASAWRSIKIAIPAVMALTPVVSLLVAAAVLVTRSITPEIPPPEHTVIEALRSNSWRASGVVLLTSGAVLVAPFAEELFFRGILLRAVFGVTRSAWLSAAISAVLFGMLHFSVPYSVPPLVFMGLALAYIRMRYDSLAACVVVHALFNARTMVFAILAPELLQLEGA